jgi:hypothetical protein
VSRLVAGFAVALISVGLAVLGVQRWRHALPAVPERKAPTEQVVVAVDTTLGDSIAVAGEVIIANDPFRLANAPATVRYDPSADAVQSNAAAQPILVRPTLVLKAIVGGPPWQAVIDGLPGQPTGLAVRAGSTYNRLTIRAITRDSVIIRGPDTTWILSFSRHSSSPP